MAKEIVQAECSMCGGRRECKVLRKETHEWSEDGGQIWGHDTYEIIQCCGCKKIFFRELKVFSEDTDNEGKVIKREVYYPRIDRIKYTPKIGGGLALFINSPIDALRKEIYLAINNGTPCLAAMGIRSLIETIARELLKEKELFFGSKLKDLLMVDGYPQSKKRFSVLFLNLDIVRFIEGMCQKLKMSRQH